MKSKPYCTGCKFDCTTHCKPDECTSTVTGYKDCRNWTPEPRSGPEFVYGGKTISEVC